jgi:hypothetical protein
MERGARGPRDALFSRRFLSAEASEKRARVEREKRETGGIEH